MGSGAPSGGTLRSLPPEPPPPLDPAGHVITCPWCDDALAFAVTAGQWHNAGAGWADIVYRHDDCPAVDPATRSERPQLLTRTQPPSEGPRRGLRRLLGSR